MPELKEEIVREIADLLGIQHPGMSTGSKEPKQILLATNSILGLGLDPRLKKPDLAREIVEAAGGKWDPDCESTGDTVTTVGLVRVRQAVRFFLG